MQVIDVHGHIGKWAFPMRCPTVNHLKEHMQRCGINKTIVSHSLALNYDFIEGNRVLAAEIEAEDGVWGYIVVNPHYLQESLAELDKYKDESKFVGVKLHPETQTYRLIYRNMLELLEKVAKLQLPVLVHTFPAQTFDLCDVAKMFPQIKFVMGHMGGNDWVGGIEAVAGRDNIWLEPCSSFPDAGKLNRAIEVVGVERVLFGTDSSLFNPAFVWGMLQDAGLNQEDLKSIAYRNAQSIFHFR